MTSPGKIGGKEMPWSDQSFGKDFSREAVESQTGGNSKRGGPKHMLASKQY